jgi:hypothetical protein
MGAKFWNLHVLLAAMFSMAYCVQMSGAKWRAEEMPSACWFHEPDVLFSYDGPLPSN